MKRIWNKEECHKNYADSLLKINNFTAIIPAAGKGTRLKYSKPKILYSINNNTLLDIIYNKLKFLCKKIIIVASPDGQHQIYNHINEKNYLNIEVVVQTEPNGMAEAINTGVKSVLTKNVIIIWGDQIMFSKETIQNCMHLIELDFHYSAIIPTIKRKNPYIHFIRNKSDKIINILQSREGDLMPDIGETDCGIFTLNKDILLKILNNNYFKSIGNKTNEWNFLPLIQKFEKFLGGVCTLILEDINESIGINDKYDVIKIMNIIKENPIGE
ncbi:NTP transferase domain-containing protein [Fluviispira multicolorata]|uniref:NTP transferase domain-containing protein n=1 Tax=Fluviispira multicolorata TaxID=2654512 RepID=A0A833N048_9BACT|nr:NTP transferase domain-containing protein [Fluviispira multicolorata]KAB8027998.1 NTP transferase domain-containing protein [Fluviispira multicolorata]